MCIRDRYRDTVEDTDIWMVDEGRAVGMKGNVENNEVIIDVAHDAKDDSWICLLYTSRCV